MSVSDVLRRMNVPVSEVHNPRDPPPTSEQCAAMERELELADDGVVTALGLHVTDHSRYHKMHEGSAEKEKVYSALCWAERRLGPEDLAKLSAVTNLVVQQATPVRVLHRRSPVRTEAVIQHTPSFFTSSRLFFSTSCQESSQIESIEDIP